MAKQIDEVAKWYVRYHNELKGYLGDEATNLLGKYIITKGGSILRRPGGRPKAGKSLPLLCDKWEKAKVLYVIMQHHIDSVRDLITIGKILLALGYLGKDCPAKTIFNGLTHIIPMDKGICTYKAFNEKWRSRSPNPYTSAIGEFKSEMDELEIRIGSGDLVFYEENGELVICSEDEWKEYYDFLKYEAGY